MKYIFVSIIKLYQYIVSPFFPPSCRFYPSCSQYAIEAISTHGIMRGGWLSIKRLSKCHPFHQGGIDLVPTKITKEK